MCFVFCDNRSISKGVLPVILAGFYDLNDVDRKDVQEEVHGGHRTPDEHVCLLCKSQLPFEGIDNPEKRIPVPVPPPFF